MGRRLYYFELLRQAKYLGRVGEHAPKFYIHLRDSDYKMNYYQAPTLDSLIKEIKAAGNVVWGSKIEDYCHAPHTAYEIVLLTAYLKSLGKTDSEIEYFLGDEMEERKGES